MFAAAVTLGLSHGLRGAPPGRSNLGGAGVVVGSGKRSGHHTDDERVVR